MPPASGSFVVSEEPTTPVVQRYLDALAGSGHGENGGDLSQEERARWRMMASSWLAEDLAAWARNWDSGIVADRDLVRRTLTGWLIDPDFAGLREPGALNRLSV